MVETSLSTPRVWAEFDDPADDRRRFRADLTWLTSSWTCIYGQGCPGLYSEADVGCCVVGAHLANDEDRDRVADHVSQLDPNLWQHHPGSTDIEAWTETEGEFTKTKVVDGACIFLNREGWPAGQGCAFHHLGAREGLDHVDVMPEACWQMPIRRTHRYIEQPDGLKQVEVTITEYDRRAWGPGGHELDWFCTNNSDAHVGREPVYLGYRHELVALMGEDGYAALTGYAEAHLASVKAARVPAQRHLLPLLVHPATLAAQANRPASPPPPPPRAAAKARKKRH